MSAGEMAATIIVHELPPSESFNSHVSTELRKGINVSCSTATEAPEGLSDGERGDGGHLANLPPPHRSMAWQAPYLCLPAALRTPLGEGLDAEPEGCQGLVDVAALLQTHSGGTCMPWRGARRQAVDLRSGARCTGTDREGRSVCQAMHQKRDKMSTATRVCWAPYDRPSWISS